MILARGDESQKKRALPRLAAGEARMSVAYLDEGDGEGTVRWTEKGEDGRGYLQGKKCLVPHGPSAFWVAVLCRTNVAAQEVAKALGVRAIFAERQEGKLTLRRGFTINEGEKALVVEDVVTTGGSTKETMRVVTENGGVVVAAGAIIDRSGGTSDFEVPFKALVTLAIDTHQPKDCPLCEKGIPFIKPGSRNLQK
jgi:alkylation response protein AidB-like acyl-CoA dehydrogenase